MPAPKGTRPPGGSRRGVPNHLTRDLREMILGALDEAGGQVYLARQARQHPAAFLTLLGKVLPQQVERGKPGDFSGLSDQQLEDRAVAGMVARGVPEVAGR